MGKMLLLAVLFIIGLVEDGNAESFPYTGMKQGHQYMLPNWPNRHNFNTLLKEESSDSEGPATIHHYFPTHARAAIGQELLRRLQKLTSRK